MFHMRANNGCHSHRSTPVVHVCMWPCCVAIVNQHLGTMDCWMLRFLFCLFLLYLNSLVVASLFQPPSILFFVLFFYGKGVGDPGSNPSSRRDIVIVLYPIPIRDSRAKWCEWRVFWEKERGGTWWWQIDSINSARKNKKGWVEKEKTSFRYKTVVNAERTNPGNKSSNPSGNEVIGGRTFSFLFDYYFLFWKWR